jgi:CRP/FNR family transcriptional regulator, cyclic AMP receptor protein
MARHSAADHVRPLLKDNTLFGGLPDGALDALIGKGHIKKYARGDVIYRRGAPGDSLMVILTGRIKITNINVDGKEVVLNFLGAGDINGEIAVIDGKERTANAQALEDSQVFVVYARDLLPALIAHPQAMLQFFRTLCEKVRAASAIIEDNTLDMRGRVAKGLLRLATQHGTRNKEGIRIRLMASQTELGNYLGLSRANVSRQLGHLQDAKVIRIEGADIIVIDEAGLSEIADAPSSDE